MAGITFTVEMATKAAQQQLEELVGRMERPLGFYKSVGEYMVSVAIPRNFANEAAPDGTPWASLRPVTLARRQKAGLASTAILRATGNMASKINYEATDQHARIGSPHIQAAVMQFGAEQGQFGAFMGKDKRGRDHFHHLPWGNIPARPFLGLSPADEAEIIAIASDWLAAK